MTQNEIIEMARQAGFDVKEWGDETLVRTVHSKGYFVFINQKLEAFAKLVAEKERELLNTVFWAFQEWKEDHMSDGIYIQTVEAIRAREENK